MNLLKKNESEDYHSKLDSLLVHMKNSGFLTDKKVESAMKRVPRHKFVPDSLLNRAYENGPLPILNGQTISQPSVVARMTEWLDVQEGQKILEIGSGSGWQTAIIAKLIGAGKIFTVERHENLANFAKTNLQKLGIKNAQIIHGDGKLGMPQESPFDRIIITAACQKIPERLLNQLELNGILVAPVGKNLQSLVVLKKTPNGVKEIRNQDGYVFVPLL